MHAVLRQGLLVAAAVALLTTIAVSSTDLRSRPSAAAPLLTDQLLVYENGFCQVFRTFEVDAKAGEVLLDLPAGTVLDTLRITGLDIIEVIARDATQPFLPGDHVAILVGSLALEGTIVSVGDRFVLETENGTRYLDAASVRSVTILDASQPVPGQMQVRVRVRDADGPHKVTLDYLLRGVSWHASHEVDVETGDWRTWATITGSPGLSVEHLTLVSGAPRLALAQPTGALHFTTATLLDASGKGADAWTPGTLDEYHEYDLDRPIDLAAGRDVRLVLLVEHVALTHELVGAGGTYSGSVTVENQWTFTNPSKQPLPAGPLAFYRDGRFIGQDSMAYLPHGEKTTLVSGSALDIPAKITVDCIDGGRDHVEIQITNRKNERTTVRFELSVPQASKLESPSPAPVRSKGLASWTFTLGPDETTIATTQVTRPYGNNCAVDA